MYEWIRKRNERGRLIYAFQRGGFAVKHGDRYVYPRIHSVRLLDGRTEFVFTLPNGLDPKALRKGEYVFRQVFGRNTDLAGDLKRFVLNVYANAMPRKVAYSYSSITPHIGDFAVPIVAGVGKNGEYVAYDMAEYPHLLIAGETGSGKSTQLWSVLTTLMLACKPTELRFVLGDLKRSEFHVFRNTAHVDAVATNTTDLAGELSRVETELTKRGDLLDRHECRNVTELPADVRPPFIVVAVDEVALLKREKAIMATIEDVSAIGRALGVFLILSMQRPDREVLDGKLKNNLTVRMAFRHADAINSRITLGESGAERIGIDQRGRFLFKSEGLREIQAPFLGDQQARKLLDPLRSSARVDRATPTRVEHADDTDSLFGRIDSC